MSGFDKRWFSVAKEARFSVPSLVRASVSVPEPETSALSNGAYARKMRRKRESKNATAAEANNPPRSPARKPQGFDGIIFHAYVGEASRQREREAVSIIPTSFSIASDGTITGIDLGSGSDVTSVTVARIKRQTPGVDRQAARDRGSPHAPAEAPEFRREYLCGPYQAEEPPRGAGGLPRR